MRPLAVLDRALGRLPAAAILLVAACGVVLVGVLDYLTGYEFSVSVFYLGPVALATWYVGRRPGIAIAVMSCVSWYVADIAAGNPYSHPAFPVWNALVRLGFFLSTGLLLGALRDSLLIQRSLAETDGLTELYGRRAFEARLAHDLALAWRRRSPITLAYVDLDDFKAVNDAYGHSEGDRVLQTTGRLLKASVRQADTAARLGGDEFAVILPDTDSRGARYVMDKIASGLRSAITTDRWQVTCSIGVVTFRAPAVSATAALAAADELMYEVKRQGKGAMTFRVLETGDRDADIERDLASRHRKNQSSDS